MNQKNYSMVIIFLVMLLDVIGFSILLPIAPFAVGRYSPDAMMVTMISFFFALAAFVSTPLLGTLGDHFGRKPVLLFCMIGSAIGYAIFGIGGALWVLFFARVIQGIAGGCISTASAYLIDISEPQERAKNMGLIGMAFGLGFILGPALGGALGQISINAPVYAVTVLSLIAAVFVHFKLPESLPKEHRNNEPIALFHFNPFHSILRFLRKPKLGSLLVVFALFNLYFSSMNSVRALYFVHKFHTSPMQLGALFMMAGSATILVQWKLMGPLVARFGEKAMAIAGLTGLAAGGIATTLAPTYTIQFPIAFLQSGISSFIWSSMGSMSASQVSRQEQGALTGVNSAISGLMATIGPLLAGLAYDHVGMDSPFTWGALFLLGAILLLRTIPAFRS